MPVNTRRPVLWGLTYIGIGIFFGIILIKGEMASWYRIQEMFRFQSFHMYGIITSAVLFAALGVGVLRGTEAKALSGEAIAIPGKPFGNGRRYAFGGVLFGLGWGLAGACPGPIYALLGNGIPGAAVLLIAAFLGTFTYTRIRSRLPH